VPFSATAPWMSVSRALVFAKNLVWLLPDHSCLTLQIIIKSTPY
jgi:hypothetical protein